jgi:hypothetical protein
MVEDVLQKLTAKTFSGVILRGYKVGQKHQLIHIKEFTFFTYRLTIVHPSWKSQLYAGFSMKVLLLHCTGAHHLVGAAKVSERRAPYMHQAGKGEEQEYPHPQEQVKFINRVHITHQLGIGMQIDDTLYPLRQSNHHLRIAVPGMANARGL